MRYSALFCVPLHDARAHLHRNLNNYQNDNENYTKYLNADGGNGVPAGLGG